MANNLGKTYHKGHFRNGEWAKHLRPYGKRQGNKRFRKTGRNILGEEDPFATHSQRNTVKKKKRKRIKVKITYTWFGDIKTTQIRTFASLRDAQNSINRHNVIKYEFLKR